MFSARPKWPVAIIYTNLELLSITSYMSLNGSYFTIYTVLPKRCAGQPGRPAIEPYYSFHLKEIVIFYCTVCSHSTRSLIRQPVTKRCGFENKKPDSPDPPRPPIVNLSTLTRTYLIRAASYQVFLGRIIALFVLIYNHRMVVCSDHGYCSNGFPEF